jgi:hypothetical protein
VDRTEAIQILTSHLDDTASEGEITDPQEYAYEVAGMVEDDDNSDVAEAIRVLASA